MRDWSLLKRRLSELRLRPYLRLVANLLIEGRTTREIATMIGCTQQEVKLKVAAILYHLSRLPPDASESAEIPERPSPAPLKPGRHSRLRSAIVRVWCFETFAALANGEQDARRDSVFDL